MADGSSRRLKPAAREETLGKLRMSGEFIIKRTVQFAEMDMAGILHFANYYRYMEEVEHAFWRSVGKSVMTHDGEREIGWPRVATSCEYFAPAHFEDEIERALTVANVGDRSVSYEIEFRREGRRIALGRTTAVCCAMENGKLEPMSSPPALRTALAQRADAGGEKNA